MTLNMSMQLDKVPVDKEFEHRRERLSWVGHRR